MIRVVAAAAIVISLGWTPRDACAGGYGIIDLGVRRAAMAATVGRPDDPSAVMHNPAGLIYLGGTRVYLSMGFAGLTADFRLKPWPQSGEHITEEVQPDGRYPSPGPQLAMSAMPMIVATHEIIPGRLVVGLGTYVANATGSALGADKVTRYHLIEGYTVVPVLTANVAYRVNSKWVVGASAGAMYARQYGKLKLYPIIGDVDATALLGSDTDLTLEGDDVVPTWQIASLIQPTSKVTIGVNLVGRSDATLEGPIEIVTTPESGPGDTFLGTHKTGLLIPWALHSGVSVDVHPKVEVAGDFRYWLYRQYKEQRRELQNLLFLNELVAEKNYHDSWQVAAGVRVHDLEAAPGGEFMFGLHYDSTPAPARVVSLDQPTFSHAGVHTGVRWEVGRYRLGFGYQFVWYDVPEINDSITSPPTNVDGTAYAHIVTTSIEATWGQGDD